MQNVCIFGASSLKLEQKYLDCAFKLGNLLARNGLGLVFGGGRSGLMGATARGVSAEGGHITGVIPEKLNMPGVPYEHCNELIVTKTMHERKAKMESLSAAYITLPGGYGTIEELMEVLTLIQLGYITAPLIILNVDGFYDSLIAQLHNCVSNGFTDEACLQLFTIATTPLEAVNAVLNYSPPDLPDKFKDVLKAYEEQSQKQ